MQATLRTARLTLVPLAEAHFDDEVELDGDPEVMRYLTGRARTRDQVAELHQSRLAVARIVPGLGFWAGTFEGAFVGWWILEPPSRPDQGPVAGQAELGYRLIRRFWRQGLASEGAAELIRHGFAELGLHRIFAETMAVNVGSRATLTKLGMALVRSLHRDFDEKASGWEQGEVEYAITRDDWLTHR